MTDEGGNNLIADLFNGIPAANMDAREKHSKYCKLFGGIYFLLTVGFLSIGVVLVFYLPKINKNVETSQTGPQMSSCFDLLQQKVNINASGIYLIRPKENFDEFKTYCDMETDGGGWTLVASIHESDINKKCDVYDRWAHYASFDVAKDKTNWENERIFGEVQTCTEDDYKNMGYFALNTNDVMIWHVPVETPLTEMKVRAKLRYRTTNHFLQKSGGNLKTLFDESYPLILDKEYREADKALPDQRTNDVMKTLISHSAEIIASIPNWYTYQYPIGDTGSINDTKLYYSQGNQVKFSSDTESTPYMTYGQKYSLSGEEIIVNSEKSQPFIMATAIYNHKNHSSYFETTIYSSPGAGSTDGYRIKEGEPFESQVSADDFQLEYRAIQRSSDTSPTIYEFHFVAHSQKIWKSVPPKTFKLESQDSKGSTYRVTGSPTNIVMGYMLLTRLPNWTFDKSEADIVANIVLGSLSKMPDFFIENTSEQGFVTPVTFDKGNAETILQMVPPKFQSSVEPGFLQFRAYNLTGFPNALCPGLRMRSFEPEYFCVGGLSEDMGHYGTCGDFAGWAGNQGDTIQPGSPSGNAHSMSDISSVILIFYR
uniref:uncharacterized protein LOC120335122 isoform X1 n=2 Tax=Styela clava TaxID=7725 RepID=UPI001939780B|nr:uncharacterized protein LOC120335122 isoform X1 [Styela clava]